MAVESSHTSCPYLRRAAGLAPYPQPLVNMPGAPASATVRIYDVSVQPVVELTAAGALAGVEIVGPAIGTKAASFSIDLGHANTIAAVGNAENIEGLEWEVEFTDNLGQKASVLVICNNVMHTAELYDGAVHANENGTTSLVYPAGSKVLKADLTRACAIKIARGYDVLDISGGTFDGGVDVPRSSKCGTALVGATIRCRAGFQAVWYPNVTNDEIDVTDATFLGSKGNLALATYGTAWHGGPHTAVGCTLRAYNITGTGARWGELEAVECALRGLVLLGNRTGGGGANGTWSADFKKCVMVSGPTIFLTSMGSSNLAFIEPTGAFALDDAASKTIEITGVIGSPDLALGASVTNCVVNVSGAYNSIADGGSGNTVNEKQLAHTSGLSGNIVNLAPGAVTATEAPNLDATVTSRAMAGDAMTLPAGAIAAATFATDAVDANALAASAATEIANAVHNTRRYQKVDGGPAVLPAVPGPGSSPVLYDTNGHAAVIRKRFYDLEADALAAVEGAADGSGEQGVRYLRSAPVAGKPYPATFQEVAS